MSKDIQEVKKMGRPTKYRKEMAFHMFDMFKEGKSIVQVAASLGLDTDTVRNWSKDPTKPEFVEMYKLGSTIAESMAEQTLMDIASGKSKGNANAAMFLLKARYGLRDVQTIQTIEEVKTLSEEDLDKKIAALGGDNVINFKESKKA